MNDNEGAVGKLTAPFLARILVVSSFLFSIFYGKISKREGLDMVPQANSSRMLPGGSPVGEENIINFCKEATPRSVVGYLNCHYKWAWGTVVYSEEAKVNAEKIKECTKAVDEIIVNL